MDFEAALALVTLAELPRVGERRLAQVQRIARGRGLPLAGVLGLDSAALARDYRLPTLAVRRLQRDRLWHTAYCRSLVARLAACGALVCEPGDREFPRRWHERANPPPPLAYVYGATELLDRPAVALLASRGIDEHVVTATVQIAQAAARAECTLVVGGMKATHRIAAVTVRAAGAGRVIVLDRGLFAAFGGRPEFDPFGFGPGRSRFDPRATLVVSVFRPDNHATPRNGRRRDELIAALGDIVVAVSARDGGEVERICLRSLDRGQCVLSWQANSPALVAAGAVPIDERDLASALRRFVSTPS
jgi:predicted Rossmann fold nucleotide-binding protein DprA/Smf involved in DNA uptake